MSHSWPALLFLSVLCLACNPYDPDLGDDPFQCGTDEPRCPDGYTAVRRDETLCVCQVKAPSSPEAFQCNDDPSDDHDSPNGSTASATPTAVGTSTKTAIIDSLAICPEGDEDFFQVKIAKEQTRLEVRVTGFDPEYAALDLSILDQVGKTVQTGLDVPGQNTVRATHTAPTVGNYHVWVKAAISGKNNYKLELQLVEPNSN